MVTNTLSMLTGSTVVDDTFDNSNWGSDNEEVEVLSSDDERTKTDGSEKADEEKAGDETATEEKIRDEKVKEEKAEHEKATEEEEVVEEQAGDEQTKFIVPEPQQEKPAVPTPSTSNTLSFAEYGNQFLNDNVDVLLNDVLKEPVETENQSMVNVLVNESILVVQENPLVDAIVTMFLEKTTHSPKQQPQKCKPKIVIKKHKKPKEKADVDVVFKRLIKLEKKVKAMSKVDHTETINKSVQARLKKVLTKICSDLCKSLNKKRLQEDILKDPKSFKTHPSHHKFYDALVESLLVDEHDMDNQFYTQPSIKKRCHDDQDPPSDADKDRKQRNSSSMKVKLSSVIQKIKLCGKT
ncbi:hypothetical protein Tco_0418532 [Tanacetum coccineum]